MFIKPIILGIAGFKLSQEEQQLFAKNRVLGFILFKRNIDSKKQLKYLINQLKNLYKLDQEPYVPLIFIDQEGGRVARLKPPIIKNVYPAARFFGNLYDSGNIDQAQIQTTKNYTSLVGDLKRLNIDSPCLPVADLSHNFTHEAIGDRSYSREVQTVVKMCKLAIKILQNNGIISIIKHIPGHGRANIDSHYDLPIIDTKLDQLNDTDFRVFKELAKDRTIKWAMTAHIIYKDIDPDLPGTISPKVIKFIREDIKFENILITDDICMLALHGEIGAKKYIIHEAIKQLLSNENIQTITYEKLKNLNLIDNWIQFYQYLSSEKLDYLSNLKLIIDEEFTQSIVSVALKALSSGCDVVLHCNGHYNEINALCNAIQLTKFDHNIY